MEMNEIFNNGFKFSKMRRPHNKHYLQWKETWKAMIKNLDNTEENKWKYSEESFK